MMLKVDEVSSRVERCLLAGFNSASKAEPIPELLNKKIVIKKVIIVDIKNKTQIAVSKMANKAKTISKEAAASAFVHTVLKFKPIQVLAAVHGTTEGDVTTYGLHDNVLRHFYAYVFTYAYLYFCEININVDEEIDLFKKLSLIFLDIDERRYETLTYILIEKNKMAKSK